MHKVAAAALLAFLFTRSALAEGKHVILLIDDSRDMRGWREPLQEKLPGWLFRGPDPTDPKTPRFDPATDTLSVLYFSLRAEGPADECKSTRGDVISPETLLQIEALDATTEQSFRAGLQASLNKPCRFDGHLSPIITSPILALPYVQKQIPADVLVSRVLIATVSNEEFNFTASSPSGEMSYLVTTFPQFDVQAPTETLARASAVTASFNFDTDARWHDDRTGLRYRVIEAVARGRQPDEAILLNRRIELDRVTDGARVLSVPKIPGAGRIHIPRSELVPLTLEWRTVGGHDAQGALDLLQCAAPVCTSDESRMSIDLFHPAVNPFVEAPADGSSPSPQTLAFRIGFRRNIPNIYDHLMLQSDWQQMELTSVPPASAWFLALPLSLDNALLVRLWQRWDGASPEHGLTHEEAVARLSRLNFAAWTATVVLLLLLIARTARRSRVYTFQPDVAWRPAGEIVLDFNRPGYSRLLVGTLEIRNRGTVGWLGRLLGGVDQPTRRAALSFETDVAVLLSQKGFERRGDVPLGFLDAQRVLTTNVSESVSDGRQIPIFLAEETLHDFTGAEEIAEQPVSLEIPVKLEFAPLDVAAPKYATLRSEVAIVLRVKPEAPRDPRVVYERGTASPLHYGHDARLLVGKFGFESRATHVFAQPWQGSFAVRTECEKRPLAGSPLRLVPDTITVEAFGRADAGVELWCGDAEVRNPDPVAHHYGFTLDGEHEAAYRAEDLSFDLRRDPARAQLELHLTYRSRRIEVHWDPARKQWVSRGDAGAEVGVDGNLIRFRTPSHYAFGLDEAIQVPLEIEIGNSARSGRGSVSVGVSGRLVLASESAGMLHMRTDWEPDDVVEISRDALQVCEGQAPIVSEVRLRGTAISSIDGGEITPDKCSVHVALAVEITADDGEVERRSLAVRFPLHLEQRPGANVVVIDFGTSSIAAAVGTAGERNDHPLLDLQHVKVHGNESAASTDPEGAEIGTPFLPSAILCDADRRQVPDQYGRNVPPGFPRHTGANGASLVPSAASFVALPARSQDLAERSGRVLLSLKAWLGMNAQRVPLPSGEIRYCPDGKFRTESSLPLDDLLEASYAALAQAYLKPFGSLGAGRVVVCHPNTFSEFHRERLRRVAWNALAGPLAIISPKHLHLMSESDAVAYAYCWNRMAEPPAPRGIERLLVYDLGAGTLDISVITIEWNEDPVYPIFRSRHHLGVPIAGNYFDETLARLIHELLSQSDVRGTEKLQYLHPVVTSATVGPDHPNAARGLWSSIRQAKQQWNGTNDFEVIVGKELKKVGLLTHEPNNPGPDVPTSIQERAGVVLRKTADGGRLVLVVPGEQIATHRRITRLLDFVTQEVVAEALAVAGARAEDVDTLIVSGRGALWPGLRERVEAALPKAQQVRFAPNEMKAAVARGAIARHALVHRNPTGWEDGLRRRLAVVYGREAGARAILDDQWEQPITIPVSTFRIVDVGLRNPDPARDLVSGSLRKHFYVGVGRREYSTEDLGNVLHFTKDAGGDVVIKNEEGAKFRIGGDTVDRAFASWPVGHPFLNPEEEP